MYTRPAADERKVPADGVADKNVTSEQTNHYTDFMESLRHCMFTQWNRCIQWNQWVCKTSACLYSLSLADKDRGSV